VDLIPKEEKIRKEIHRKRKHVFFAAGILLLFVLMAHSVIQGKIDKVNLALSRVQGENSELPRLYKAEVGKLEKQTGEELKGKMDILEGVGDVRQGAVLALRSLEKVLAKIPDARAVDTIVKSDDVESAKKAVEEGIKGIKDKLWIPYASIALVQYPENVTSGPGARGKAQTKGAEAILTVPAYKVRVFAVIKAREDATVSNNDIQKMLEAPLENELTLGQWTKRTDVSTAPGTDKLDLVYYEPGKVNLQDGMVQQGGKFYGAMVEWFMLPKLPPQPPKEVAAEAAADDKGDAAKKPGKGPRK
jgi:hypothetical protein